MVRFAVVPYEGLTTSVGRSGRDGCSRFICFLVSHHPGSPTRLEVSYNGQAAH